MDLRKKTPLNKIKVEHILHRFYKWTDQEGNEVDPKIPESMDRWWDKYNLHRDSDGDVMDIKKNWGIIYDLMEQYMDKYDSICYDWDTDPDGYTSQYKIVGRRLETDEECQVRIAEDARKRQQALDDKEAKKREKEEKKKAKELQMLEELKSKYKE